MTKGFYGVPQICAAMKVCYDRKVPQTQKLAIKVFDPPSCNKSLIIWPQAQLYLDRQDAKMEEALHNAHTMKDDTTSESKDKTTSNGPAPKSFDVERLRELLAQR